MGSLKDVGCAVGEQVGDGKGEDGTDPLDDAAEVDLPDSRDTDDRNEHGSTSLSLLVFYDCEATGLSTYSEHLTDIAAKVLDPPFQFLLLHVLHLLGQVGIFLLLASNIYHTCQ